MDVDKVLGEALASTEGLRRVRAELAMANEIAVAAESYVGALKARLRDAEAAPLTRWPGSKVEERVAQGSHAVLSELLTLATVVHLDHKASRTRCAYCGDVTDGAAHWCGGCQPDV